MKKQILSGLLAGAMVVSLVACGGSASTSTPAESTADTAASTEVESTGYGDVVYGYTCMQQTNPFHVAMRDELKKLTEADGNTLLEFDGNMDQQLAANPGGAPANMAVAASRLGCRTAFIGKVGRDAFGDSLRKTLRENGVDISAMLTDPVQPTTLAVVTLDATGERSFSFYRNPGADTMLRADEVPQAILENTKFFHFGSVSLTADPERTATLDGIAVKVGDTNGAGDTFLGAFLSRIKEADILTELDSAKLREAVAFANKAASITTSRHGAMPAMPTLAEVLGE